MQYDAITLDTNLFHHNGFNLEGGMLGQLSQFKEGSAQLVLSEIVGREVVKYLKIEAKKAKDKFAQSLKDIRESAVLPQGELRTLEEAYKAILRPEEAARIRLSKFMSVTGFSVVSADSADIKELIKRYFAPSPPFEGSANKKNEFPDAIALLTLEAWAKEHNKRILAISLDKGWASFAKDSAYIDVEPDLTVALEKFQKDAEEAKSHVERLLDMIESQDETLYPQLIDRIDSAVDYLDVEVEASSAYSYEEDGVSLSFVGLKLNRVAPDDFSIVQTGRNKIVAKLKMIIDGVAYGDFALSVWDSVDKENVPMGNTTAKTDVTFEASVLITFEGQFLSRQNSQEIEITSVEIVEGNPVAAFGDIELNWRDDDSDQYEYNDRSAFERDYFSE